MEGDVMEGDKIFVELTNGRRYSGKITNLDKALGLIKILDKFNNPVWFSEKEIKVLQVEKDE